MSMAVNEEWRNIENYLNYEISNFGKVRNKNTGRILKSCNKGGYCVVGLSNIKTNTHLVHRLLAKTFLPNPENKPQVNHIDKNSLNNHISNLEWNTSLENNIHKSKGVIQTTNQNMCIYRIDIPSNQILETYNSIELASKWVYDKGLSTKLNGINSCIGNAVRGVTNTSYGYKWSLEEQPHIQDEIWKEIKIADFNSENYYISSLGRFKNSKGIIMKDYKPHHTGYIYVRVNRKKFGLHRLVALMFIDNLENKPFVNHIDGNKLNNSLANLEWVTCAENNLHNYTIGLNKGNTRKIIQYDLEMNEIQQFNKIKDASTQLNLCYTCVKAVLVGKQKTTGGFIFKYLV